MPNNKKYYPSGYQIITLGNYSDGDNLVTDASPEYLKDAEVLLDLLISKELPRKPILLTLSIDDELYSGFVNFQCDDDGIGRRITFSVPTQEDVDKIVIIMAQIGDSDAVISYYLRAYTLES